jgi:hypothetical protein
VNKGDILFLRAIHLFMGLWSFVFLIRSFIDPSVVFNILLIIFAVLMGISSLFLFFYPPTDDEFVIKQSKRLRIGSFFLGVLFFFSGIFIFPDKSLNSFSTPFPFYFALLFFYFAISGKFWKFYL